MALQSAIKRVADARKKYDAEMRKVGKGAQKEVAAFLAGVLPAGFAIQWEQYTPYFNDGEACEFSVNSPTVFVVEVESHDDCTPPEGAHECPADCKNGVTEKREGVSYDDSLTVSEVEYSISRYGSADEPALEGLTKTDLKAIVSAFKKLDEDFLLAAFGDHTTVVVFSNGKYTVNDCSHD